MEFTVNDLPILAQDFGIIWESGATEFLEPQYRRNYSAAVAELGQDALPPLLTTANNAIPALFTTFIDPTVIEVAIQPNKGEEIYGSTKKGDWVTDVALFTVVESTGYTSSYGDYNNNGQAGVNVNYPQRQSYHYQIIERYGDKEIARAGEARLDLISRKDRAAAIVMDKFYNDSLFYGIAGLQNYGGLNDPALPASITPNVKTAGGTGWANATALEIYNDFLKQFKQLQSQSNYLVERDTPMTWALPSNKEAELSKTNEFNLSIRDRLSREFPNLKIKTAPQFITSGGALTQLIVDSVDGIETTAGGFTEKLRTHGPVRELSAAAVKKSAGTWGTIIFFPWAIASMLGI